MKLKITKVGEHSIPMPAYQTAGAAGLDLCAALDIPVTVYSGQRRTIGCGYAFEIPEGYEGQVRPRSGLARKNCLAAFLGTIDSDYRSEVGVILMNHSAMDYIVQPGDRIAQLVIAPVARVELELGELSATERGENGYGSTGR